METQQQKFDADAALAAVRAVRAVARRRTTWGKSRLAKHRSELVKMHAAGASYADLALWLRTEKRVKVDRSTVMRYLKKLPELANG